MEAIEELTKLSQSMSQAAAVLADEEVDEKTPTKRPATFLNAVALGNVGAGKSAMLNSLIGHPVLPTGENGATRAPISIDLQRDPAVSSRSIVLQSGGKSQEVSASSLRHSLQDTLSKGSGKSRGNEIHLKLRTSTGNLELPKKRKLSSALVESMRNKAKTAGSREEFSFAVSRRHTTIGPVCSCASTCLPVQGFLCTYSRRNHRPYVGTQSQVDAVGSGDSGMV